MQSYNSGLCPPFEFHLPTPLKCGVDNEPKANQEYLSYAKAHGKKGLITRKCGFIIHPTMGWLGASPDVHVTDPHSDFPDSIAEFKYPFSKKEVTPHEATQDRNFYCYYESVLHLKNPITTTIKCNFSSSLEQTSMTGVIFVYTLQKVLKWKGSGLKQNGVKNVSLGLTAIIKLMFFQK